MRTTIILLTAIFAFSCGSKSIQKEVKQEKATQIKLAAYNVEYSKNASASEIGEALKSYGFDVVCFSEAPGGDWTKEVGSAMGLNHVVVGKYSTAGHEDKYKTIASRTPLYDFEEVLMADTLHTATRAKTKIGNTEFVVYSVHFPFGWRDQAHIDETTNKVQTFVNYLKEKQHTELAIVAGDFNFIPINADSQNAYHKMFIDIGLDVSWKELGIDCTTRNTHNALKPEDNGNGEVIDHIMYNPAKIRAVDGEILEMEKHLSDHKPVWALLELR
ncbi:MAG: endonuclease/exonuclease/phosphatase family protein [Cytophagales bacterium]|nr:endonuclease/exonuclease/phosphatase family protein [Cytophagales bacterium]